MNPPEDPRFFSLVLEALPDFNFGDVVILPLPEGTTVDPILWAEEIFRVESVPGWVKVLFVIREALVGLIGVRRAPKGVFAVQDVRGEEALILSRDRHLDFGVAVAVDPARMLLRITTAVMLHGWRGRLYFLPVRVLHAPVTRAMAAAAMRRLGPIG